MLIICKQEIVWESLTEENIERFSSPGITCKNIPLKVFDLTMFSTQAIIIKINLEQMPFSFTPSVTGHRTIDSKKRLYVVRECFQ